MSENTQRIEQFDGRARSSHPGSPRTLLVGGDGVSIDEFLEQPVTHWLRP